MLFRSDNFFQMLSYFVQSQSIGERQVASKPFLSPVIIHGGGGQFHMVVKDVANFFYSTFNHFSGNQNSCIPHKSNIGTCGIYFKTMTLVLFILPSPILGVIALAILKTISQVARILENRKEVDEADVVLL